MDDGLPAITIYGSGELIRVKDVVMLNQLTKWEANYSDLRHPSMDGDATSKL